GCPQGTQHAFALPHDGGILTWPFFTPITAKVGVMAIGVVVAVRLVVLMLIAHHIPGSKAVVGRQIVNRGPRASAATSTLRWRAQQAVCQVPAPTGLARPISADSVPKLGIPFGHSRRVVPQLIPCQSHIPRFGY